MESARPGRVLSALVVVIAVGAPRLARGDEKRGDPSGPGATVTAVARGFESQTGRAGCSLFRGDDGFPNDLSKAFRRYWAPIRDDRTVVCRFRDVPPGRYAVAVMHDENGNEELDRNLVGVPQEGWGVSRDASARAFGPPRYGDAAFRVGEDDRRLTLRMNN